MPAARPTLYLVDSMSNIHRAYHAIQRLSTSAGRPTNAVYGFVTMLRKMVREHSPDPPAAAWDGPQRTQRHEAYAEYKANRAAMADDLASQLPDIREALAAYRIPLIELPGYEADDVIGSLAKKAEAGGFDVVIVTADKDMLQLVSGERIRVFHTGKEIFLDDAGVTTFFGVPPAQVADVLALMGDSVDNVPGVPGVGQVTAKKWIAQYGSLPALLEHVDEIKGKVGESLRAHREDALLSRRLVEIPVDLPVPFDPTALRRSEPDYGRLKELFVRLEFHSLAAEIHGDAAVAPEITSERVNAGSPFPRIAGQAGVALLRRNGHALLALSSGDRTFIAEEDTAAIAARWKALERTGVAVAMGDAKPLDALLAGSGEEVRTDVFDVCLAQYVLAPGVASAELEPMAFQRLGQRLLPDKEAGVSACALPGPYEIANADRWLAERASAAAALAPVLTAELAARPELDRLYREIERPLTPVLARMERAGVAIDAPFLGQISKRMEGELRSLEQRIWAEAGEEFNVNSPVKLAQILFEKLKYPSSKKTAKTRISSTGVEVLTELAERGL